MGEIASAAGVAKALKGIKFPANGQDLAEQAEQNGAPDNLIQAIQDLPEEQDFQAMADVEHAFHTEKAKDQGSGSYGSQSNPEKAHGGAHRGGKQSHKNDPR